MTPALLPVLGLLLGVDAPPAQAPADRPPAAPPRIVEVPLPPPPVLSPRPAAAKPVPRPIPLPPPPVLAAHPAAPKPPRERAAPAPVPSAEEPADGELLIQQKCSKCHDVSWVPAGELSDVQWRGHLKRPGVGVTDEQVRRIQRALHARRARSAAR